jgi:hypothetical protein
MIRKIDWHENDFLMPALARGIGSQGNVFARSCEVNSGLVHSAILPLRMRQGIIPP